LIDIELHCLKKRVINSIRKYESYCALFQLIMAKSVSYPRCIE